MGSHLAGHLSRENHDVTVIEASDERIRHLQDDLDILVVEGNGASPTVMSKAGIDRCDLMMALTNSDETNMIACLAASQHDVPFKIARVSNMDYYQLDNWLAEKNLGTDLLVNPEFECALQIGNLLNVPGASDVAEFCGGRTLLVGLTVHPDAPCVDDTLQEIQMRSDHHRLLVCTITRGDRTIIPTGQTRLQAGDKAFLICLRESVDEAYAFCGLKRKLVKRVMILGGSKVAVYLCKMLERKKVSATLLENLESRAESLAEELDHTLVIQSDPTNVELWEMEGLDEMDAFLALTTDDEENLLSGLIARNHDVPVVIALLEKLNYVPLVNKVGVNTAVSSRLAIVDTILKYVRRGNVMSLATLKGNEAEIIEFLATKSCRVLNTRLMEMKLPRGVLFGAITRGREIFIPTGHSQIEEGDKVVVIVGPVGKRLVEELFA